MNILPKKKWHVRTKENVARVRRDEAKAAAEEKVRAEKVTLADNEDRIRRLKRKGGPCESGDSVSVDPFSQCSERAEDPTGETKGGHVNFFLDLEEQERKNLSVGNKDYAAEKKKEKDDWESKMGKFQFRFYKSCEHFDCRLEIIEKSYILFQPRSSNKLILTEKLITLKDVQISLIHIL